jgi:hypothetical protein
MCPTARRMNRNELPQMTEVTVKSNRAFRFTFPPLSAGDAPYLPCFGRRIRPRRGGWAAGTVGPS